MSIWDEAVPYEDFVPDGMRMPIVDVYETGSEVCVDIEIPGVERDDIEVDVIGRSLRIRVEREQAIESEQEGIVRSERRYAGFFRVIPMPDSADLTSVSARYDQGVLKVRTHRRAVPGSKVRVD